MSFGFVHVPFIDVPENPPPFSPKEETFNNEGPVAGRKAVERSFVVIKVSSWFLEVSLRVEAPTLPPIILPGRYLCNSFPPKTGKGPYESSPPGTGGQGLLP